MGEELEELEGRLSTASMKDRRKEGELEDRESRRGDQIRNAPAMLEGEELRARVAGRMRRSWMRMDRRCCCVVVVGLVVGESADSEDRAVCAAGEVSFSLFLVLDFVFVLVWEERVFSSAFRCRKYVFKIPCIFSLTLPSSVPSPAIPPFWGARAASSRDQYHSHSQSRLSRAADLRTKRGGRWRWTMLCRVSRMWGGMVRKVERSWVGGESQMGRERRRSSCVSV
jgi:hypothetical protein